MDLEIQEIRRLDASDFAPLLAAESRAWLDGLHWDYSPSSRLISNCLEEKRLMGHAVVGGGRPRAYCFYFAEDGKGLIADLFVEDMESNGPLAAELIARSVNTLIHDFGVSRIEAQLPHFPFERLEPHFHSHAFDAYVRLFLAAPIAVPEHAAASSSNAAAPSVIPEAPEGDFRFEPWSRKHELEGRDLLWRTYHRHVDAVLNDQYSSREGVARLLDNVAHSNGCGEFLPDASQIVVHRSSGKLAGLLAITRVRAGTAHVPQIAVGCEFQGVGVGTALLKAAFRKLSLSGYSEISLTVTALNAGAVRLYERLGFRPLRAFGAFVWERRA